MYLQITDNILHCQQCYNVRWAGTPEAMLDLWLMLLLLHTQHHDSLGHTYHIQHLVIHFISSNNLCHILKQQTNLTKI